MAIEVPINAPGPWRVRHQGVAALVGRGNLEVAADTCTYAILDQARQCAIRAVDELPRTPFVAAGFNIRYRIDEVPQDLGSVLNCGLDDLISEKSLSIRRRRLQRSVSYEDGSLNLELDVEPDKETIIQFNFHRGSTVAAELKSWLSLPILDVQNTIDSIMGSLPGVTYERTE